MLMKKKDKGHDALQVQLEEYKDTLQRLQAEFENYQKRVEKEKTAYVRYANEALIGELLEVLDSFEKALETKRIKRAIEPIHKQLLQVLERHGLKEIKALGQPFDPFKHEAIMVVEGDGDDIVVEEMQKGYMIHDKVLRPSKVKVSVKKKEDEKHE